MINLASRPRPVELSGDPAFAVRVKRLGAVSVVGPGVIWWLAATQLAVPGLVLWLLASGWFLMPTILWASVPRPSLRPLLVIPSTLLTLPLLAIVLGWLPSAPQAALGWILIAAGLLMGSLLGLWFWFRWLPVPAELDAPFAAGRWALIALHVALIVGGTLLVALA